MTRYIDADALIEKTKDPYRYCDYEYSMYADDFIEDINSAPTIDAVEVVRCKNCKYLGIKDYIYGYCKKKVIGIVKPNDFCSYGERKQP